MLKITKENVNDIDYTTINEGEKVIIANIPFDEGKDREYCQLYWIDKNYFRWYIITTLSYMDTDNETNEEECIKERVDNQGYGYGNNQYAEVYVFDNLNEYGEWLVKTFEKGQ